MRPALLLVDLQRDFLATVPAAGRIVARAAALLRAFRDARLPVVHVRTTYGPDGEGRMPHWEAAGRLQCVEGTPGHEPPPELRALPGEPVARKRFYGAFEDPRVGGWIEGCDAVVLAGVHLHACIRQTALEAYARGFAVLVAEDAVGSDDPLHAASTRRWLEARAARFVPVAALPAPGPPPSTIPHRSPLDPGRVLYEVPVHDAATVAAAAETARAAWDAWRDADAGARRALLARLAADLRADAEALAARIAYEVGKPLALARAEVRRAIATVEDAAARATGPCRGDPGARRREVGLVGAVTPWNNPLAIPLGKIAPALAFGNAVLWKPAPAGAGIAETLAAMLPEGLVGLVHGGSATARHVASQADALSVTGSPEAGWALQEIAAARGVPFQAELGGNNGAIVWEGADLDEAARELADAAFAFAGQRCTATRRAIVPAALHDRFAERLAAATTALRWGDPLDAATRVGPLVSAEKRDEVAALLGRCGAEVRAPHRDAPPGPAYLAPALVVGAEARSEVVQEETFGPVLVLQPAGTFDEALELLDGVPQGLAASMFGGTEGERARFLRDARAGLLALDAASPEVDVTLPFGGWKASGAGPAEHGEADAELHGRRQAIYRRTSAAPAPGPPRKPAT